ncbi:hypothetical protein FE257_003231 [Aspergillus nanangensis]|uniref:C2H2-type domain-containing protein n=1 Tax=Aspergillus nanangensis TaxID=2582783 RepID=A0AAD4CS88_ASPNN|nr:hypothetical protein FE257_003231 [Aspergillus nanangensis]
MFSQYTMSPSASSCPPMEQTFSNSSEFSMQSSPAYFDMYLENDLELFRQASNSSVYPSSSASSFSSSYPSSYEQSYFPPTRAVAVAPALYPMDTSNQHLGNTQCFPALQNSWTSSPVTQLANPIEIEDPLMAAEPQYSFPQSSKVIKPYLCVCGKAFTRPADLKRHEASVHNPVYQDCPVDGCLRKEANGFPRRDHLIEHLRSYHQWDVPKRRVIKRVKASA